MCAKKNHCADIAYLTLLQSARAIIMSKEIVDDKSEHCVPFILGRIKLHGDSYKSRGETPPPFFIGLNGVQGAGKTTLVGEHL